MCIIGDTYICPCFRWCRSLILIFHKIYKTLRDKSGSPMYKRWPKSNSLKRFSSKRKSYVRYSTSETKNKILLKNILILLFKRKKKDDSRLNGQLESGGRGGTCCKSVFVSVCLSKKIYLASDILCVQGTVFSVCMYFVSRTFRCHQC